MTSPGTFTITVAQWNRAVREGRVRLESVVLPMTFDSPDAYTKHGGEHAIDRWADDGGRA